MIFNHLLFLQSVLDRNKQVNTTESIIEWIKLRNQQVEVRVTPCPLKQIKDWYVDDLTGDIRHQSGKFFSIQGLHITTSDGVVKQWSQPIINQPEVGYLGFLVKKLNGVLHFLVQAKIEPGNVNIVQLSPTIQATRSNFSRVHHGKSPMYLDYFAQQKGNVLIDQLQSEQGGRFFRKRNRNIIIEISDDVPPHEDFKWVTLGQIKELLSYDNLVNMDTRTVISGINYGKYPNETVALLKTFCPDENNFTSFNKQLFISYIQQEGSSLSMNEIQSWITDLKSNYELQVNLIPLRNVTNWIQDEYKIYHEKHRYFEVMAVDVEISNREVSKWSQPIIKPTHEGIVAFIAKEIDGLLHFLVQAKLEIGNFDIVELAPTVQCITGNYRAGENEYEVPYLNYVLAAKKEQIKYDVMLSEEGGRFYKNQNRNMLILADRDFVEVENNNYRWFTLNQLMQFMQHNNYVNIEARSLLSVLSFK